MNVKELISKVRFSHVLCLSIGALIPIYSDVLFLHGFDSSTVSAIMDSIVAISVIYAAYSVKNWMQDKVKNKGFEHAEILLMKIHQSYIMTFSLKESWNEFNLNHYTSSFPMNDDAMTIKNDISSLLKECKILNVKLGEILADLHALKSWDMICHEQIEYIDFIEKSDELRKKIEAYMNEMKNKPKHIDRCAIYILNREIIDEEYKNIANKYVSLKIRFEDVFEYAPPNKEAA